MTSAVPHRNLVTEIFLQAASAALAFVLGLVTVVGTSSAQAQTYTEKVLHTFTAGNDGASPNYGGLVKDARGNFWGVTTQGGSSGVGTLYKVDQTGKYKQMWAFQKGSTGIPCSLVVDEVTGNLYGVSGCGGEAGGVWQYHVKSGKLATLYAFSDGTDGGDPLEVPFIDAAGNLYGSTLSGGIVNGNNNCFYDGCGVVYKLDKNRNETVLYSFTGNADGSDPVSNVVPDATGDIYGMTTMGGMVTDNCAYGCGVVYKIDTKGDYTVLHTFSWSSTSTDGAHCYGHCLNFDANGTLWGITGGGGLYQQCYNGCGTLFKINTKTGEYSVEYNFAVKNGAPSNFVFDKAGNLWGTTQESGVIFERPHNKGKVVTVFGFTKRGDGVWPQGPPAFDKEDNIYGATSEGGKSGYGVVFNLTLQKP